MPHLKYQLQKRFTRLVSKHYRGFGIDSPYIYHLIREVIEAKMHYYPFKKLDRQCHNILSVLKEKYSDENLDEKQAWWYKLEYNHLKDCTKLNRFLFRLVNFVNPDKIAFIGNDSGLNLAYLANVDTRRKLFCLGHSSFVYLFSNSILKENGIKNVHFGDLNSNYNQVYDFIQISRSVESEILLEFGNNLNKYLSKECYLIIENINKDEEKKLIWNRLKEMDRFNVSLDLFDVGILIAKKGLQKQDHILSGRSYK